MKNGRFQKHNI